MIKANFVVTGFTKAADGTITAQATPVADENSSPSEQLVHPNSPFKGYVVLCGNSDIMQGVKWGTNFSLQVKFDFEGE